jgi:hypothetical protein
MCEMTQIPRFPSPANTLVLPDEAPVCCHRSWGHKSSSNARTHLQEPAPCRLASRAPPLPAPPRAAVRTHTETPATTKQIHTQKEEGGTQRRTRLCCSDAAVGQWRRLSVRAGAGLWRLRLNGAEALLTPAAVVRSCALTRACWTDSSHPGVMPCAFSRYAHSSRTCAPATSNTQHIAPYLQELPAGT